MKIIAVLSLFFGVILTIVGMLPFIFPHPVCDGCQNSGPENFWELILMLSYDGKRWYLIGGLAFLLLVASLLSNYRINDSEE
ncbi:hypothetical protein ORD22_10265 [Sporosarcina sp. GW1-11]|uniref:hypothetical protein n=1 Tax=Sporosarcina sp. GW1-11 TaxID=2899126 RepID=UPI00294CCEB1|nr:hypothetical protein [Sporosarcina sp. GW1-11]MDV6378601.1 hypothetical protein [Sporosarcina sp. GW1-11]